LPGESVAFAFFVSDVVGTVSLNPSGTVSAVVTPKHIESVISIKGWNYKSTSNYLRIIFGTVGGGFVTAGSGSVTSGTVLESGSGNTKVYASFADFAAIGGVKGAVGVVHLAELNVTGVFEDANITATLDAVYGSAAYAKITTVTFPANANDIIYDPALGAGNYARVDGGVSVVVSVLLLCLIVLFI